ncbi:MAG: hypothetical protein AAFR66_13280 [Bacteroidota bacterium]
MIIPPNHLAHQMKKDRENGEVFMEGSHLCLSGAMVSQVFKEEENTFLAFYPEKKLLLLSPVSNAFFKKMHPSTQHMLKRKNLKGAKSVALHELLIDHELSVPPGPLDYEYREQSAILKIFFP